jgi:hypothetical protein
MPHTAAKLCPSCGRQHELYLPLGSPTDKAKRYEFTCPKTQAAVPIATSRGETWEPVDVRPRGSIVVYESPNV